MAFAVTKCDVGGSTANGYHYEYLCESADDIADLPTGASSTEISKPAPGSLAFIESDSSARYILKISREWGEYPMASGGGGGGNSGNLVVTLTWDNGTATGDKTGGEVIAALTSGTPVFVTYQYGDFSSGEAESEFNFIPLTYAFVSEEGDYYGFAYKAVEAGSAAYLYAATTNDYLTSDEPGG